MQYDTFALSASLQYIFDKNELDAEKIGTEIADMIHSILDKAYVLSYEHKLEICNNIKTKLEY